MVFKSFAARTQATGRGCAAFFCSTCCRNTTKNVVLRAPSGLSCDLAEIFTFSRDLHVPHVQQIQRGAIHRFSCRVCFKYKNNVRHHTQHPTAPACCGVLLPTTGTRARSCIMLRCIMVLIGRLMMTVVMRSNLFKRKYQAVIDWLCRCGPAVAVLCAVAGRSGWHQHL